MTQTTIQIGAADVAQANALLTAAQGSPAGIDPPVLEVGLRDSYQLTYATYAMAGSTPWASPDAVALPYGTPPAGIPALRIWQLPDDLVNLPQQPVPGDRPPLPCLTPMVATVDETTGTTATAPVPCYGWATQIGVTVRRLPVVGSTPAGATTYELVGANEYDVVLLERMLTASGLSVPGFGIQQLALLHATTGGAAGLASDGANVTTFITQANLSTVTRPPQQMTRMLAAPVPGATQKPVDFVRLLWECSVTRSGGFYLFYSSDPVAHTGLPDAIFNDRGEAVLTLLVVHAAPGTLVEQNRVASYMNALVTAGYVDPASAAVYAQARPLPAYVAAGASDALAGLGQTYRMTAQELAAANADVTLGATITVNGGSYQVRPSAPGGVPADVATWFGTTVAALQAANPGVSFAGTLDLWSTIDLPDGLTVAAGTAGRTTLADVAAVYDVTVDALAGANGWQPGIFAGQTIAVAELVTPASTDALAAIAARNYMDPVQLAEDNAAVPLAQGVPVAVAAGSYEVPATAGAGALAAIASRFAIDASAIQAANPNWIEPQPALALVNLPAVTVRAGTSPGAGTLGDIAAFYGVRLARLALDNAGTPGLFAVPLRVRGGPLVRHAASPPGTVTYALTRTAAPPPTDTGADGALQRLYSLLSYRVPAGLTGFAATDPGPPLGPLSAPPGPGGDKMRPPRSDGLWRYQKAVPYARLAPAPTKDGPGPDPALSPYLGTGGVVRLDLQWNDLFGNRGLTPFSQPALDPTAALNQPPAQALYNDPIIGLSEWPSVGFDYQVVAGGGAGTAAIEITVTFDACTYLVDGEQGCPVTPGKKVDPVQRAQRDAAVYARLWYQLATQAGGGLAVTVDTTLLPGDPKPVDPAPLQAFAAAVHDWLIARAGGTTSNPAPTMAPITVAFDVSAITPEQIFELGVSLVMSRPPELVDPDLLVESKAAVNASTIPAHQSQDVTGGPYTLQAFAKSFEQALVVDGQWRVKLAVGVDREKAERSGSGAPLWGVRIGVAQGQPLAFAVDAPDAPTTYAPRPIANVPWDGPVPLQAYVTGTGLTTPPATQTFAGIDLDAWTAQLLGAVDRLLSPGFATAIGLVDSHLPGNRTPHLQELATAKESLAAALAQLVIPVLPDAVGADPYAAREALRQQMLVQLGSFYTTDAIVQFGVAAASQSTDPPSAPQLFGALTQTGDTTAPVTLSDPKIPLAQPTSGPPPTLTFLIATTAGQTDVAQTEAELSLQLAYDGTHVEHQIAAVPGITGYVTSSWLSFVRAESSWPLSAALGPFTVPLVLRGFPTPPTMRAQSGTQSVEDGTSGLKLADTLSWDYQLVYSEPIHYQQDTVHLSIEFNHVGSGGDPTGRPHGDGGAAFAALAQFVTSYPAVQQDLDAYVAPVDPSKIDPSSQAFVNGDVALSTFTAMAQSVASALTTSGAKRPLGALPVESYDVAIGEDSLELESRTGSKAKVDALRVTVAGVPDALGATIAVDVGDCAGQTPPSGVAAPAAADGTATYSYVYVDPATGDWLTATAGETIGPRTVTIPGMNILARQDAWASVYVGRNENAVEQFQYQTPAVSFASPQYPTNVFTQPPIEVAAIGSGSPVTRTPEAHLAALFAALFSAAPKGQQTLQLEVRYEYGLSGAGLGMIDLPVYLLAPTPADPTKDLVVPEGGCPSDPTQGPLVCRLGGALRTWRDANRAGDGAGAFVLSLTVMSELTAQPLLVLDDLQLAEQWIDWSS